MAAYFQDINAFNAMYPQEKVYLHFDNTAYFLEETIWFKAYVMAANAQRQSQLSKVLYVELLSPEGAVLETKKYPIVNGGCHGEFHLDSLYLSGYYEVRAYTRYMLNFGDDAVFSRVFPVYKNVPEGNYHQKTILDRDLSRRKKIRSYHDFGDYSLWSYIFPPNNKMREMYHYEPLPKWEPKKRRSTVNVGTAFDDQIYEKEAPIKMEFFPEGGVIVDSMEQQVAFQISDKEGRGLNIPGEIVNSYGKKVASITPLLDGMGVFNMYFYQAEKYKALIRFQGKTYRFDLPRIYESGCALGLRNFYAKDSIHIVAKYRKDELFNDSIVAVALSRGGSIYQFYLVRAEGEHKISLAKRSMPEGVNVITVFDKEGRALAERSCFITHPEREECSLKINHDNKGLAYNPYDKVHMELHAEDAAGKALPASISLAVRDAGTEEISYNSDNFYTWLLLSSELKGYIKDVAYYFEKQDRVHQMHLDLLMLTRGWSRYQWENMNERYKIEGWKQPIEKGIMADGNIINLDYLRKPSLKNANMSFSFYSEGDSLEYVGRIKTNEIGNYAVQFPPFYGKGNMWVGMRDYDIAPKHMVSLNRWFSPTPKYISYYELNVPTADASIGITSQIPIFDDGLRQIDLEEVGIQRRTFRRRIQYQYSLQHYDVSEELEYMMDVYKIPLSMYYQYPESLVMSIMDRYNFPPCDFNTVLASSYTSDTDIPKGKLFWRVFQYQKKLPYFDEIVIRSEPEVREAFWVKRGAMDVMSAVPDTGFTQAIWTIDLEKKSSSSAQAPTRFKLPDYNNSDTYPDCVAFYLPTDSAQRIKIPLVMGQRRSQIQGYSYSKDFVHPDYSSVPVQDLPRDYRRTLYWNPNVTLDENGRAEIEFFNNSTCRHLSISAEGLSHDGKPLVYKK
ncbi:MAG: hypothetical protein IIX13_07745 [Bacteroidales bacterium]|nr:hypothetical protein [Bacteroidales bacterium]